MKNLNLIILTIAVAAVILSCSGNGTTDKGSDKTNDTIVENSNIPAAPKDRLLPDMVEVDKPVPVSKLYEAFYEWKGVEVTVAGYAKIYGDSEKLGKDVQLRGSEESFDALFDCRFKEELNKEINATDILIIKGKMAESSYSGIVINDCELVSLNGKYKEGQTPSPYVKQTEAYAAKDLYDAYNVWIGTEITVIGHYNSTTTSTMNGNSTWRIDLEDPESGQKMVGCTMRTEPDSDKLAQNRDNVKIRGRIAKDLWGSVQLEDCVIVE